MTKIEPFQVWKSADFPGRPLLIVIEAGWNEVVVDAFDGRLPVGEGGLGGSLGIRLGIVELHPEDLEVVWLLGFRAAARRSPDATRVTATPSSRLPEDGDREFRKRRPRPVGPRSQRIRTYVPGGNIGVGIMGARLKRAERIIELLHVFGEARTKKLDPFAVWVPLHDAVFYMAEEEGLELEALLMGKTLTEAREIATAAKKGKKKATP